MLSIYHPKRQHTSLNINLIFSWYHWYAEKFTPGMRCNAILVALEVDQVQRELYLATHHEGQRDYFKT